MNQIEKLAALLLAVVLAGSASLAGCQKKTSAGAASGSISTASGDTKSVGVLRVGVDDSYPPMEYKDDSGNLVGFDVDMTKEIAKRLGKKAEFVSTQFDGLFQALNTGKYDTIISAMSMTDEREQAFEFTKPYIANAQMIVVKPKDTSIKKAEDLSGKKVGCQISSTANDSADYLQQKEGIKFPLSTYDQIIQPFQDMKAGRLDAIIVDEVVGQYYIAQSPKEYKAAAVKLTNEPIGACFKKGNTVLRDEVQQAIDSMTADGTMKKLSEKWFKADLTSNIDAKLKTLG